MIPLVISTLDKFAHCSGCKVNLTKSEAVWIGSKKGCNYYPFSDSALVWKVNQFKTQGINFSIQSKDMFDLNYKVKLKQIRRTLNCWRTRNLSLIRKICVIKTPLFPQLLPFFSFEYKNS